MKRIVSLAVSSVFLVAAAWAGDGRIQLSQINFASPPYVISTPGSYVLTENITVTNAADGIDVTTNDVTIDLNGFTLSGVEGCGIKQQLRCRGLRVFNGNIVNWVTCSLWVGKGASIENIRAAGNGGGGFSVSIVVGSNSTLRGCTATGSDTGIQAGPNCTLTDCTATDNGEGIYTDENCNLRDCVAVENASFGIWTYGNCTVSDCTASGNGTYGISAGDNNTLRGCTAAGNGAIGIVADGIGPTLSDCTAYCNLGDGFYMDEGAVLSRCASGWNQGCGIIIGDDCVLSECTAFQNTYHGFSVGSGNRLAASGSAHNGIAGVLVGGSENVIEGNNVTWNAYGIQVTAIKNVIMRNTARGNSTLNWSVVANNICYVVSAATCGAISGDSGGTPPGSTDPSANFSY